MSDIIVNCQARFTLYVKNAALIVSKRKNEEVFPIANIQSFSVKKPGLMGFGTITFRTAQAATVGVNVGAGISAAFGAEKVFSFTEEEYEAACKLRDYILSFSTAPSEQPTQTEKVVSVVDEIRGLKELLDEGILTQDEFDMKKRQLLGL